MPTYEYFCAANQRKIEVRHGMTEEFRTWGDVCKALGTDVGDTPAEAPVERMISGGMAFRIHLNSVNSDDGGGYYCSDPNCRIRH